MAAFTADSINILNGQDVAEVISQEAINTIQKGDFLVIGSFPPVEILQAYKNGQGERFIELLKPWPHTTQANQPAIVIPTTVDYREAVEALQAANTLVSDNKKAMLDWQTNMGTVTFKDKDGNDVVVKTLKQIEADNQAQMNAYHPYPWAIRKAEFEAMRAANEEKFAADGFVHLGKHYSSGSNGIPINEGLWARIHTDNLNTLRLGNNPGSGGLEGKSKTYQAVVKIGGVITKLDSLGGSFFASLLKFPTVEDGTRTYDSATGNSVKHATSTLAFAAETDTNKVVITRVDMWGLKGWLREITDSDPFVYKNGLPQSLATDINGVPTVSDTVNPVEYFAWYKGETTSRGKGVNWKTATEAQRMAIASDPDSNIVFDDATGKFYQWTVLGNSWAGFGNGDWQYIDVQSTATLRFDINSAVNDDDGGYYVGTQNGKYNSKYTGSYQKYKSTSLTGEYLLICGTVPRLNMGSYHPSHNDLGAGKTGVAGSGYLPWNHSSNDKLISRASCFKPWDGSTWGYAGGDIATGNPSTVTTLGTGRPDGRYYDTIYASGKGGVCRDMRYSAWGLTPEDFAAEDFKIKSGQYRGFEQLTTPLRLNAQGNPSSLVLYFDNELGTQLPKGTTVYLRVRDIGNVVFADDYADLATGNWIRLIVAEGHTFFYGRQALVKEELTGDNYYRAILSGSPSTATFDVLIAGPYGYPTGLSVSDEYQHKEVVADPFDIFLCDDLKGGWVGSFNPVFPSTGVSVELTRPCEDSEVLYYQTDDDGGTWTRGTRAVDSVTNIADLSPSVGTVTLLSYKAKAKMTKSVTNSDLYGLKEAIGDVFAASHYGSDAGSLLGFSLISKVLKANTGENKPNSIYGSYKIKNYNILSGKLSSLRLDPEHEPLLLPSPNNGSPAFKALDYRSIVNQQGFLNYAYTELTYDATAGDWGDDGKIHIANNQTTMPDENGHTVLVGTARCVEPLGWIKNDK